MAKQILDDELWQIIEPLLPKKKRRWRYPGRKPLSDREVLTGILFDSMHSRGYTVPHLENLVRG